MIVEEKYQAKEDNFIDFMANVIDVVLRMLAWIILISVIIIGTYELTYIFTWDDIGDDYSCVMNNFYIDKSFML